MKSRRAKLTVLLTGWLFAGLTVTTQATIVASLQSSGTSSAVYDGNIAASLIQAGQSSLGSVVAPASSISGTFSAAGLNDGSAAGNPNLTYYAVASGQGTIQPVTLTFNLAAGYNITNIQAISGWGDHNLGEQLFQLLLSIGGGAFTSYGTFTNNMSFGAPGSGSDKGAYLTILTDSTGVIATNVTGVQFVFMNPDISNGAGSVGTSQVGSIGGTVIRELQVFGTYYTNLSGTTPSVLIPVTDTNVLSGLTLNDWVCQTNFIGATADGASLTVGFTGTNQVALRVDNSQLAGAVAARYPILAWSVNGGPFQNHQLAATDTSLVLAAGVTNPVIDLYIEGMSPFEDRYDGDVPPNSVKITGFLVASNVVTTAVAQPAKVWLNIGDSIMSGDAALYAAGQGRPPNDGWAASDDGRASYGYLLARHYGYQETRLAYGGYDWAGGLANVPALTTLIDQKTSTISRLTNGFLNPIPNVVLINLGENGAPATADVTNALFKLRSRVIPATKILVMIPAAGTARTQVTQAFNSYTNATLDTNAFLVDLGSITYPTADGQHPTALGHQMIYQDALPFFDPIIASGQPIFGSSPVAEPYSYVSSGSFSGPAVPLSPDPLVSYRWPGPQASDGLQIYLQKPITVTADTNSSFVNLQSLTGNNPNVTVQGLGSIQMDFGRENAAWLEFDSPDLAGTVTMSISEYNQPEILNIGPANYVKTLAPIKYGNTYRLELNSQLYEGVRFGWIHVMSFTNTWHITGLRLVCQSRPANYDGGFSCSDPLLTRIWYAGAYTVKLNLLANSFGALLADRGDRISWTGDAHPAQAAALAAFGNYDFIKENLASTANNYNGIASYALYWVLSLIDYYNYTGDAAMLNANIANAQSVLNNAYAVYGTNPNLAFYGWDERLGAGVENPNRQESENAYKMLSIRAWAAFAAAMGADGRADLQTQYNGYANAKIAALRQNAAWYQSFSLHACADAVNTGLLNTNELNGVFAQQFTDRVNRVSFSPFNQYFVLQAFAAMDKYDDALNSVNDLWGGEINYGGTTFFEVSRPSWDSAIGINDPVPNCQNGFTSLCHAWGAGVTKWLSEEVLGIKPTAPGFTAFQIIPHLGRTLTYVSGQMPTPLGIIQAGFNVSNGLCTVSTPAGTVGTIGIPKVEKTINSITINGTLAWDGTFHSAAGIGGASNDTEFVYFTGVQPGNYSLAVAYSGTTPVYNAPAAQYAGQFLKADTNTSGNWGGVYGKDGYVLCNYNGNHSDKLSLPSYVASVNYYMNSSGLPNATVWATNTNDPRALASDSSNQNSRNATDYGTDFYVWNGDDMTFTINCTASRNYQVALYFVDWENEGRRLAVEMHDANTLNLIAPVQVVTNFSGGCYLVYAYKQSAKFRIEHVRGDNAVLSGIFFDTPVVTNYSTGNAGLGGTIVYTDTNGLNPVASPPYVGGYVVHTFAASDTLTLPNAVSANVLMVAGGGGGGGLWGGGGGAGGLIYTNMPLGFGSYPVTVGAGGAGNGSNNHGANGSNSVFSTLTALGGGGGGIGYLGPVAPQNGGSGGGGGGVTSGNFPGGTGQQPGSASGGFGNNGGSGLDNQSFGGGGGAGAAGGTINGGAGLAYSISGVTNYYAGGGGGAVGGNGGLGGGGNTSVNGDFSTGGGGGGGVNAAGGTGGSGIVIVRFPYVANPLLTLVLSTPTNSQYIAGGFTTTIVGGGAPPYSVTYHYKLTNNPTYTATAAVGPFGATNTFSQTLGTLLPGVYQIYATVADSAANTTNSATTNFFTVYNAGNTGQGGTITYTDPSGLNPVASPPYVGGYVVQTFTVSGTLTIPSATNADVLVVAGGGGGGGRYGCGGGAGGLVFSNLSLVGASNYPVTIGAGGAGYTGASTSGANAGASGANSVFGTLTALGGGGGGGGYQAGSSAGQAGGSGGGGHQNLGAGAATQSSSASGGFGNGGYGFTVDAYGGGGGAGAAATNANGGNGRQYAISGVTNYYAGGGGGINNAPVPSPGGTGLGGLGGGGNGGVAGGGPGSAGAANTGGGGGGNFASTGAGNGGSGIVIVRYPFVTVSASSTNLTCQFTTNTLKLSWPSDHIGWRLQVQTNSAVQGLGTNWFDVAGATMTNQLFIPVSPAAGSVFYRMTYP